MCEIGKLYLESNFLAEEFQEFVKGFRAVLVGEELVVSSLTGLCVDHPELEVHCTLLLLQGQQVLLQAGVAHLQLDKRNFGTLF